ncbi:MAG: hypothetical protein K1V99_06890 [Bacteroidales bacterium]|nr:hypothetical protein [Bacteroidales bacterium]
MKTMQIMATLMLAALCALSVSCNPAPESKNEQENIPVQDKKHEEPDVPDFPPECDWFIRFDIEEIVSSDGKGGKWVITADKDEDLTSCFLLSVDVEPEIEKGHYDFNKTKVRITEFENELFRIKQLGDMSFEIEVFEFPKTGTEQYNVRVMFSPGDSSSKYIFGEIYLTIK